MISKSQRVTLGDWLNENYFDEGKKTYFFKVDVEAVSALLQLITLHRPFERPQLSELLHHTWFDRNPLRTM
jgi:hypothetical protein